MIKKSQLLTKDAIKYRALIEEALEYAEIDPAGMKFHIGTRIQEPHAIGHNVYVPSPSVIDDDNFVNSIAHEAKHVELTYSGKDYHHDELEEMARSAGGKAQKAYEKAHGVSPMMALAYSLAKVPRAVEKCHRKAVRAFSAGVKKL